MWGGSEEGSYVRLVIVVSLNFRLDSNKGINKADWRDRDVERCRHSLVREKDKSVNSWNEKHELNETKVNQSISLPTQTALDSDHHGPASERRGNSWRGFQDFCLQATAGNWS